MSVNYDWLKMVIINNNSNKKKGLTKGFSDRLTLKMSSCYIAVILEFVMRKMILLNPELPKS